MLVRIHFGSGDGAVGSWRVDTHGRGRGADRTKGPLVADLLARCIHLDIAALHRHAGQKVQSVGGGLWGAEVRSHCRRCCALCIGGFGHRELHFGAFVWVLGLLRSMLLGREDGRLTQVDVTQTGLFTRRRDGEGHWCGGAVCGLAAAVLGRNRSGAL